MKTPFIQYRAGPVSDPCFSKADYELLCLMSRERLRYITQGRSLSSSRRTGDVYFAAFPPPMTAQDLRTIGQAAAEKPLAFRETLDATKVSREHVL
jgi:hypothetical protein